MQRIQELPDTIEEILSEGSRANLERLLATHELDARDDAEGRTLLSFPDLPDDVIVQLVEQGLDVDSADAAGATPLWERAFLGRPEQIPLLLSLGADVQAPTEDGLTPLHAAGNGPTAAAFRLLLAHGADPLALAAGPFHDDEEEGEHRVTPLGHATVVTNYSAEELVKLVEIAELMLAAGDVVTSEMRAQIADIGEEFEDHRVEFTPDELAEAEPALRRLYEIFDVPPATARVIHDGTTPIIVPPGATKEQMTALWRLLVPPQGNAASAQGEVVRICDLIEDATVDRYDADPFSSWDGDHVLMLRALRKHLRSGEKLSRPERKAADRAISQLLDDEFWAPGSLDEGATAPHNIDVLAELVLAWIHQNPTPLPLGRVKYEG